MFNDKHLSYNWDKAKRMVAYRPEGLDLEWGANARHAVSIFYADPDAYGFHNLEALQCMVERRRGGETGVKAVQYIEKQAMWDWVARTPWAEKLLNAALAKGVTRKQGDLRQLGKDAYAFRVWYRDGLETASFMTNGIDQDAATAVEVEWEARAAGHANVAAGGRAIPAFACLVQAIEKMFESGKPTYPVERTLLTSGILEALLTSKFAGHKRIETPHLTVQYTGPRKSFFCMEKL